MPRKIVVGALAAVAVLMVRALAPTMHRRLVARCEAMFDRMPESLPPKRMLRGIEEIRTTTARIEELLGGRPEAAGPARLPDGTAVRPDGPPETRRSADVAR